LEGDLLLAFLPIQLQVEGVDPLQRPIRTARPPDTHLSPILRVLALIAGRAAVPFLGEVVVDLGGNLLLFQVEGVQVIVEEALGGMDGAVGAELGLSLAEAVGFFERL